jgi:hypothetical protein
MSARVLPKIRASFADQLLDQDRRLQLLAVTLLVSAKIWPSKKLILSKAAFSFQMATLLSQPISERHLRTDVPCFLVQYARTQRALQAKENDGSNINDVQIKSIRSQALAIYVADLGLSCKTTPCSACCKKEIGSLHLLRSNYVGLIFTGVLDLLRMWHVGLL